MTIRSTNSLSIERCIEIKQERRFGGTLFEDDIALSIRRFCLSSVVEDDTDPTRKIRNIWFYESEFEYEYWYVMYGKTFDEKPNQFNEFTDTKLITFEFANDFDEEVATAIQQSQLSGIPVYEELIRDAMIHSTHCSTFQTCEH